MVVENMSMAEVHDYSEYAQAAKPGDNLMKSLVGLADDLEAAEAEVERLQALMDEATENVRRLKEKDIPNLVDGLDAELTLPDGRVIKVAEHIRASIGGERAGPALAWLAKNGHGSIIKRQFIVEFGKNQEEFAQKFEKELKDRPERLNVKRKNSVHPQTLLSWIKEQLASGKDIPKETFGIFRQRIAEIKD